MNDLGQKCLKRLENLQLYKSADLLVFFFMQGFGALRCGLGEILKKIADVHIKNSCNIWRNLV